MKKFKSSFFNDLNRRCPKLLNGVSGILFQIMKKAGSDDLPTLSGVTNLLDLLRLPTWSAR